VIEIDQINIPDRTTIRWNEKEKLQIQQLAQNLNEQDLSKIMKFALSTSLHHINFVTGALVSKEWEVIFQRKRKTQQLTRKIY